MKLDDTHPDYFLDDDEPQSGNTSDPRTIRFDDAPADTRQSTVRPDSDATPAKPHHRWRRPLIWTGVIVAVVLAIVVWLRYFNPIATDQLMRCYIIKVERRGMLMRTFEADVVSESALTDTARLYSREQSLSIASPELAYKLQELQGTGRPVTVGYVTYQATVPWRGASRSVITSIDRQ